MTSTLASVVISSLVLLMPFQLCIASERDSIVWLADGVSVKGIRQLELYPTSDETRHQYGHDPALSITETIRKELEQAGITVADLDDDKQPTQLALKTSLIHFEPGSVGGRWIGFGGGSAVCVLRTFLIKGPSGDSVGEIIVAKQVSAGGLFSAGAESYVPTRTAKQTAQELAELLGVKLRPDEDEPE